MFEDAIINYFLFVFHFQINYGQYIEIHFFLYIHSVSSNLIFFVNHFMCTCHTLIKAVLLIPFQSECALFLCLTLLNLLEPQVQC